MNNKNIELKIDLAIENFFAVENCTPYSKLLWSKSYYNNEGIAYKKEYKPTKEDVKNQKKIARKIFRKLYEIEELTTKFDKRFNQMFYASCFRTKPKHDFSISTHNIIRKFVLLLNNIIYEK